MKILVLPDLHVPFTHWPSLEKVADYAKWYKPDRVIQLGDIIDAKAWSRYPKDPDDPSPDEEWRQTEIEMARLAKLFPEMTILSGNHDRRPMAKAVEAGLPSQLVRSLRELFPYPGWHWHLESKPYVLDGIVFCHGDEMPGPPGLKASKLGKCLVQGHTHKASLTYVTTFDSQVWGLECGAIIDPQALAFRYAARSPMAVTRTFVTIDHGVPVIIPLLT